VTHVEFPVASQGGGDPCAATFAQIENLFARSISPDEVAAIVVEPIQGEGGYLVPPADFLPRLAALAKKHGILLIADEVQSGMGRTGRMFACQHFGVEPDIVCVAKGIASGMPLGAIIAKSAVMNWPPGSHASTFGGNPVACMAALETIKLLESELMDNATHIGAYLLKQLRSTKAKQALIHDVRGLGLMVGVELRRDGIAAVKEAGEVIQQSFRRGLLLLPCGKSTIRFCPPLVIDEQDVDIAVGIVDEVLGELAKQPA
jgi:4-aminobutyrate aminotransferase